jgi:hypothetical protein
MSLTTYDEVLPKIVLKKVMSKKYCEAPHKSQVPSPSIKIIFYVDIQSSNFHFPHNNEPYVMHSGNEMVGKNISTIYVYLLLNPTKNNVITKKKMKLEKIKIILFSIQNISTGPNYVS